MNIEALADVVSTVVLMGRPFQVSSEPLTLSDALDAQDALTPRLASPLGGLAGCLLPLFAI